MVLKSTLGGFISTVVNLWKAAKDKNVISGLGSEWKTRRKNASRDCLFKKIKKAKDTTSDGDGDKYFIWKECKDCQGK